MQGEPERRAHDERASYVSGGWFYAWWRGDPLPALAPLAHFAAAAVETRDDVFRLAFLGATTAEAVGERRRGGNRAYVATVGREPAGFGWSAARSADIGELGITLKLTSGERYLWDFLTLPAWRGRGIYPHLLQAVIARELGEGVDRFWIGHEAENAASARGILRAGFRPVGELLVLDPGRFVLAPSGPVDRARQGAALLGIPVEEPG